MTPHSQELRRQILAACAEPGSKRYQVAASFNVSLSFVVKLLCRQRTTGGIAVKPHAGGMPIKLTKAVQKQVLQLTQENPSLSLHGLQQALVAASGPKLATTTIQRALTGQLAKSPQAIPATVTKHLFGKPKSLPAHLLAQAA